MPEPSRLHIKGLARAGGRAARTGSASRASLHELVQTGGHATRRALGALDPAGAFPADAKGFRDGNDPASSSFAGLRCA